MFEETHYQVLEISEVATQAEIKRAYRRLAKLFHPDSGTYHASHERISRINEAYEVLSDTKRRGHYDRLRRSYGLETPAEQAAQRNRRTADVQSQYRRHRQTARSSEAHIDAWMTKVYNPVDRLVAQILSPLKQELRTLAGDPFDDELMEGFQAYLEDCRTLLEKAQTKFQSMPNPATTAKVAASLYHCLNQLQDGIEEMERFTYCYEESYLHTGQELFRISTQLRREAKARIKEVV
jgi:molecular chaperone DnaJ